MSGDVAIRAEGLGKKYVIGHQVEGEGTLRDAIVRGVGGFGRSLAAMARGRAIIRGDALEEFWALRDISFEVRRGEVLGVVGRNGAGKSTLLKVLSRITEPSEGRVTINGRVSSLLEVGTGFHPELTGRENIFLNGAVLGMSRAEIRAKFDEIVDFAGVERFLDTPVKRYSSGMYVRLAFAVAAHLEPEILIVDEVLAVGDAEFQKKCLGKMQDVAGEGRTVLFVSHNLQAVERLCTRAVVLGKGELVYDGGVADSCRLYAASMSHAPKEERLKAAQRRGGGPIHFTEVEVLDNANSVHHLPAGEPLHVRIHYRADEDVRSPLFGFALLTAAGVRVFNTAHCDQREPIDRPKGDGYLDLRIEGLTLAAGTYMCNVSVEGHGAEYYDYITDMPLIEIRPSRKLPGQRPYDQSCGVVYPEAAWSE